MSDLQRRLEEHRAMRDAARRVLEADLGVVRGDGAEPGVAKRAVEGVTETSHTLLDRGLRFASNHPLLVGGGLLALLLVLFRNPLLDFLINLLGDDDEDDEDDVSSDLEEVEQGKRAVRSDRDRMAATGGNS